MICKICLIFCSRHAKEPFECDTLRSLDVEDTDSARLVGFAFEFDLDCLDAVQSSVQRERI